MQSDSHLQLADLLERGADTIATLIYLSGIRSRVSDNTRLAAVRLAQELQRNTKTSVEIDGRDVRELRNDAAASLTHLLSLAREACPLSSEEAQAATSIVRELSSTADTLRIEYGGLD